ncbi:hypothetical protein GCM10023403_34170 [Pseudonocardia benzenivorans]
MRAASTAPTANHSTLWFAAGDNTFIAVSSAPGGRAAIRREMSRSHTSIRRNGRVPATFTRGSTRRNLSHTDVTLEALLRLR